MFKSIKHRLAEEEPIELMGESTVRFVKKCNRFVV